MARAAAGPRRCRPSRSRTCGSISAATSSAGASGKATTTSSRLAATHGIGSSLTPSASLRSPPANGHRSVLRAAGIRPHPEEAAKRPSRRMGLSADAGFRILAGSRDLHEEVDEGPELHRQVALRRVEPRNPPALPLLVAQDGAHIALLQGLSVHPPGALGGP